ncbi:MAG: adenine deaminase [Nitrososphaerales archaeon]|nr:adenine deaminase [Nitrososphaerales archaeon]
MCKSMFAISGKVVNVFDGEVRRETVYIKDERVFAVGDYSIKVDKVFDLSDYYLLPGFIDAHIHIESSMLTPTEFAKYALLHGTTCLVLEPHEIANVCGIKGIEFMLSSKAPFRFFFTAPSCVPATTMETSAFQIGVDEVKSLLKHPKCVGLGELMNYVGVIQNDPKVIEKIKAAKELHKVCDGHAPQLRGLDLCKYVGAGIQSDHECVSIKEASEKLKLGMYIMIREGSAAKNLESLIDLAKGTGGDRCMFVSDDIHVSELIEDGHLDRILRKAVSLGLDPIRSIKMVTINPARYFGLEGLGAIAPNHFADIVAVKDLKRFEVKAVFVNGTLVVDDGKLIYEFEHSSIPNEVLSTIRVRDFSIEDLKVRSGRRRDVRVIRVEANEIVTKGEVATLDAKDGFLIPDIDNDILPLIVFERHKMSGNIGKGFVSGFGLKSGALASTVAHDSHNIVCVGADYEDIGEAVKELRRVGGGLIAVNGGKVMAELKLPIAGLMSDESGEYVKEKLEDLHEAARSLGCKLPSPFMTLSFLSLPVIPELKLTDKGLVDVNRFDFVEVLL